MKSSKKLINNKEEVYLEITIGDSDSELIERLKKQITTHKLPNKKK
jgi:hypothetical protein